MTDIKTITSQFKSKTFPKEHWTHNAHFAVAFVQLDKLKNQEQTLDYLRKGIKEYNLSVGTDNTENSGYHETLTVFWLKAVYEYYNSSQHKTIEEIYNNFSKTILASAKFPTKFYSKELLFSKKARQTWTKPDLLPISEIKEIVFKNMEQHFILTDKEFEEQFANYSLEPKLFSHEAHLRIAWTHIVKYGEPKAIKNITEQLQNFVRHIGAADKYNETLTIAAIKAVTHFMRKGNLETFYEFITTYPRLKHNFENLINQHYSIDIFNSIQAKEQYIEPDLLEFT